ncbi:SDR family NAD(P)-dependent oxidoreductase [Phycisphaerales bacterium AB-hyl4]|uniref:SDR family NAD(P)-dependent oxidoreductase n=1 Tax=Natronomicrosphaera hydrolytica TaxID=3242702 RepID=A0ABV4UB22_9BACT
MQLQGKHILITAGAGVGVGAGVVDAVVEAGGRPLVNDVDTNKLQKVRKRHPDAMLLAGDVSEPADVDRLFAEATKAVGQVHGLANNAGVGLTKPVAETTLEEYDRLHAVDSRGVWLMSRAFLQHCRQRNIPGSIVNVSSIMAYGSMTGYGLYAQAKAGVEGLTRGIAVDYGRHGIRCNAIAPGYVHAEQNLELMRSFTDDPQAWVDRYVRNYQALERQIEAIDCGRAAVFLLSEAARMITGQVLRVDGGISSMAADKGLV